MRITSFSAWFLRLGIWHFVKCLAPVLAVVFTFGNVSLRRFLRWYQLLPMILCDKRARTMESLRNELLIRTSFIYSSEV